MASYRETALTNQMQIFSYPLPHLHAVEAALYFKAGPIYEDTDSYGISHLLQHMCLRNLNGIVKRELAAKLDAIGACLKGSVYPEAIVFRMRFSPRFFDAAMDILNRFFAPGAWSDQEIADEKAIVLRQIENEDPAFWADIRDHYWRTGQQLHSLRGALSSVKEISAQMLHGFKNQVLHPANACLVLTGNFSTGMHQSACDVFSQWPNQGPSLFEQPLPFNFCCRDSQSDQYTHNQGHKGHVHLSFDINDELVFPICVDVLNTIVGEGMGSALYVALRDQLALTDEVVSYIEEVGQFRRMVIEFSLPNSHLKQGLSEAFAVLYKLTQHISTRKMNRTRIYFGDNQSFLLDSASTLNNLLGWGYLSGRVEECDSETKQHMYQDVAIDDMLEAAQTVFRPENLCCYVSSNPGTVDQEGLKKLIAEIREQFS